MKTYFSISFSTLAATLLATLTLGTLANAMTVTEAEISGKTNLVGVSSVSVNGVRESILTDAKGLSLYTFEQDSPNVSNCTGNCLGHWPPQHVPAGSALAAPFGTINGNDGQIQLTLNGLPLYHYDDDVKPGDAFGQYPDWDAVIVQP